MSAFLTDDQKEIIRRTFGVGAPPEEIAKFIATVERTGLDPFARQLYFSSRYDKEKGKNVWLTQVSIDGLRVVAERTGAYEGQTGPFWCGQDGVWREMWPDPSNPPFAAKVGVFRAGFKEPIYGVARWKSYHQTKAGGGVSFMWSKMDDLMLGKCAEALALRRAFPQQLSGLYAEEEMSQADMEPVPVASEQPPVGARQVASTPQQVAQGPVRVSPPPAKEQPTVATVDESKPANAPPPPHDPQTGEVLVTVAPDAPELPQLKELLVKGLGHGSGTAMAFLSEMTGRPIKRMGELTLANCQDGIKLLTTYKERLDTVIGEDPQMRGEFQAKVLKREMTSPLTCGEVRQVIAKVDEILQPAVEAAAAASATTGATDDATW